MRLGRYVLAEILILASCLAGAGVASTHVIEAVSQRWGLGDLRYAGKLTPRRGLPQPPETAIAEEPSGTFLGMSDDLLLDRVRRQPIVRMKLNRGGSSLSFRVDFADGSRASFKPAQTNLQTIPRKEVAAYRLNRLLGLNAVPPAAPRLIGRDELLAHLHEETLPSLPRIQAQTIFNPLGKTVGVMMYWIPEIKDSGLDTAEGQATSTGWLTQGQPIPVDKRPLAAQVSDMVVFDFLTSNPDRYSGGNMKMSADGQRLYFMDNTMAFFLDVDGNGKTRPALARTQRFSRRLFEALDRVTVPQMERMLAADTGNPHDILTPSEMRAVVARRDTIRRHIDGLMGVHGQRNVLVFP